MTQGEGGENGEEGADSDLSSLLGLVGPLLASSSGVSINGNA